MSQSAKKDMHFKLASKGKIDTTHVVHYNALSDIFRKRIVWIQPKQNSDRVWLKFLKNRIGSD